MPMDINQRSQRLPLLSFISSFDYVTNTTPFFMSFLPRKIRAWCTMERQIQANHQHLFLIRQEHYLPVEDGKSRAALDTGLPIQPYLQDFAHLRCAALTSLIPASRSLPAIASIRTPASSGCRELSGYSMHLRRESHCKTGAQRDDHRRKPLRVHHKARRARPSPSRA